MESVALVTGCSSGIGLETAIALGREGHFTYATMRDVKKSGRWMVVNVAFGMAFHLMPIAFMFFLTTTLALILDPIRIQT